MPAENLVGRAEFIFFSHDPSAAGWLEPWKWPQAIRFSRFFQGDPLKDAPVTAGDVDLASLGDRLGHSFKRAELAVEALTHRGTLDKRADLKAAFPHGNERLEFLGDRVLSLAMADLLLRRFPHEREGQLARRHAALVSARTLGEIAEAIGLRDHLHRLSRTLAKATPAILADMLEALLGAVFVDAGFAAAAAVVEHLWGERLGSQHPAPRPPKTAAAGMGAGPRACRCRPTSRSAARAPSTSRCSWSRSRWAICRRRKGAG